MSTPLCHQLGITYPIFSVGMAIPAGPELAAAVSNAGGCGVLGAGAVPPPHMRTRLAALRRLTDRPFGVNLVLDVLEEGQIEVCFDENIPILVLFWGDPAPYVKDAHHRGIKVFIQVGSVEEAIAVATAGVDAIIAQGVEGGGHVKSTTPLSTILPTAVEAVKPVPVIAAGGIADGKGIAAALRMGAQAVSLGTRFLCSKEAQFSDDYTRRVAASKAEDTIYTSLFDLGWPVPHRVLRNQAVEDWESAGRPPNGQRPGEGTIVGTLGVQRQLFLPLVLPQPRMLLPVIVVV